MRSKKNLQFSRLNLWLVNHTRACLQGLGELVRTPLASAATIAVIGIATALPVCLYLVLANFQGLSQNWHGNPSISLYLKQNTSDASINKMTDSLRDEPAVQKVRYISPAEGLAEFNKMTQLNTALSSLKENPLPAVLVVTPIASEQSPSALENLLARLKVLPDVDIAQLDMTWVKRLHDIVSLGQRLTDTLAILFSLAVILIIGNTIRLTTQHHRQEITMLRLIGATHAFIQRPLLYRGVLYGLLGGCFSWLATSLILWWLASPAQDLAQSYHHHFVIQGLNLHTGVNILLLSAGLGWLGSWVAVRHHLTAQETL